ncbi:MAG: hypothetical protein J2P21_07770, partial [Chloracidobacterium sp.]|nr:hypothetical protein [Chloracidobacterium sp.]
LSLLVINFFDAQIAAQNHELLPQRYFAATRRRIWFLTTNIDLPQGHDSFNQSTESSLSLNN